MLHALTPTLRSRLGRTLTRVCIALALCTTTVFTAPPAAALDARKTAEALAQRAAKAFEGGNMVEAATLYREAYKMDPAESAYLYGAARASHSGRDLVRAMDDYVAFLALPGADPARLQKAKTFLESLRQELSAQKMVDAKKSEDAGDVLLAKTFYLEAWRMAPDRSEPLLKAAILERQLGDKQAAIGHLRQYLQIAPADASGRGTAEALLTQLGETQQRTPPQEPPPPQPPVPVAKPTVAETPQAIVAPPVDKPTTVVAPPERTATASPKAEKSASPRRVLGWSAVGLGGGAVLGAVLLAGLASSQQATLDGNKSANGHFDALLISVDQAASEQTSINSKWTGMGIAAGVGVAAIGVGVWLVAGAPTDVAIVPTWDGLSVAGRF